jgi:hypothetical protein
MAGLELYDHIGTRVEDPMALVLRKNYPAEFYVEGKNKGDKCTVMANMACLGDEILPHWTDGLDAEVVRQKIYIPSKEDRNKGVIYHISLENKALYYAKGDSDCVYFRESDKVMPKMEFRLASDPALLLEEFKSRGLKLRNCSFSVF